MSWRIAAMLVLTAMASVSAQQSQDPTRFRNRDLFRWPSGREVTNGGVVIGTVVEPGTGRGVPMAVVTLSADDRTFSIATDPLGRYYFVDLPEGEYQIRAEKQGYVAGEFGRLRPDGAGHPLRLRAREWRVDGNIDLWRTGTISGFVGNEIGEPVVGVQVQAMRQEFVSGGRRITEVTSEYTDDRGEFRIIGLIPGDYLVVTPSVQVTLPVAELQRVGGTGQSTGGLGHLVSLGTDMLSERPGSGLINSMVFEDDDETVRLGGRFAVPPAPRDGRALAYPTQYYPSADIPMQALAVPVSPGEDFSGISFYLRPLPTVSVSGLVIGPDGPIGNQLLRLVPDTGEDFGAGFETAATVTKLDGSFRFPIVLRGSYVIDARSPAAAYYLSPTNAPRAASAAQLANSGLWSRTPVTTVTDNIENLTIVMAEGATVDGSVTFAGRSPRPRTEQLAEMRVALHPLAGGRAGTPDGQPDAAGDFRIPGVLPGEYHVSVSAPTGWVVESVTGNGQDLTSLPLDTTLGGSIELAVTFTDRATDLTGTVRNFRGFVVKTATVIVFPSSGELLPPLRTRAVRADASGIFRLSGLPPGDYYLVAIEESASGNWQEPYTLALLRAGATVLTLRSGERRNQDLRLTIAR